MSTKLNGKTLHLFVTREDLDGLLIIEFGDVYRDTWRTANAVEMQKIFLVAAIALFVFCHLSHASPVDNEDIIAYVCSLCGESGSDCLALPLVRESCVQDLLAELGNIDLRRPELSDLQKRRGFIGKRGAQMEKRRGFIGKRRGFIG
ncbi:hypothetical protein ACTXT7_001944 [Hymenolepis weldensis]